MPRIGEHGAVRSEESGRVRVRTVRSGPDCLKREEGMGL